MGKYIWLVILALPVWAAVELDAPKWVTALAAIPFFLRAATLGDAPDEHLLGEGFAGYRPFLVVALIAGAIALGVGLLAFAKTLL